MNITRQTAQYNYGVTITPYKRRSVMNKSIHKTGEKPGQGRYRCTNCGTQVVLDDYDKMPPCPKCNNTEFKKA